MRWNYYKLRQVLQSAMDLLQIAKGITKCDDYYKLRQVLQSEMTITNCDNTVTYPRALVMFHPLSTVNESSLTLS